MIGRFVLKTETEAEIFANLARPVGSAKVASLCCFGVLAPLRAFVVCANFVLRSKKLFFVVLFFPYLFCALVAFVRVQTLFLFSLFFFLL